MRKVVYILGLGRSGSTLLSIALGNDQTIFNASELNRYPKTKGVPLDYPEGAVQNKYWADFKAHFEKSQDQPPDYAAMATLFRRVEYHSGYIKTFLNRHDPEEIGRYKDFVNRFFDSLFTFVNKDIIIDGSKYSGRALALAKCLECEVCFIYLKRDPVGVVHSFRKQDVEQRPKSWLAANIYYFIATLLCEVARWKLRRRHKFVTIKYDSFVNNPLGSITTIEQELGLDLGDLRTKLQQNNDLETGNLFYGNRIRLKPTIRIKKPEMKSNNSLSDLITRILQLLWWR